MWPASSGQLRWNRPPACGFRSPSARSVSWTFSSVPSRRLEEQGHRRADEFLGNQRAGYRPFGRRTADAHEVGGDDQGRGPPRRRKAGGGEGAERRFDHIAAAGSGQQIVSAHELRHEAARGHPVDLARPADLDDAAAGHDHDPVGQGEGLGLGMRHVHEGDAEVALQAREHALHADDQMGVQRRQRLVQQQDLRLRYQRARQGHALALPARQSLDIALGELADLQPFQPSDPAPPPLGAADPAHLEPELDILPHIEEGKQRQRLPDHRRVAFVNRHVVHQPPADANLALGRRFQPGDHSERRRLAAARRAHDRDELARRYFQVQAVHRREVPEPFDHAREDDERIRHVRRIREMKKTWARTTSVIDVRNTSDPMAFTCGSMLP